jgi:hypothetical protein
LRLELGSVLLLLLLCPLALPPAAAFTRRCGISGTLPLAQGLDPRGAGVSVSSFRRAILRLAPPDRDLLCLLPTPLVKKPPLSCCCSSSPSSSSTSNDWLAPAGAFVLPLCFAAIFPGPATCRRPDPEDFISEDVVIVADQLPAKPEALTLPSALVE